MLKTTVYDGLLNLGLKEHILETSSVHSNECCGLSGSSNLLILAFDAIKIFQNVVVVVGEVVVLSSLFYHLSNFDIVRILLRIPSSRRFRALLIIARIGSPIDTARMQS